MKHLSKHSYTISEFQFRKQFEDLFGIKDLENMHNYLPDFIDFKRENDSASLIHKIFYANFQAKLSETYIKFLSSLVPVIGEDFYFQSIPCVRFGFPKCRWLSEFHTDDKYFHPTQELNINLAITRTIGSASLQIEKDPGLGEYIPLDMEYGEFVFIDHINCVHGSITNAEMYTMISLDFRVIPLSLSAEAFSDNCSVLEGKRFARGSYFYEESILEIQCS